MLLTHIEPSVRASGWLQPVGGANGWGAQPPPFRCLEVVAFHNLERETKETKDDKRRVAQCKVGIGADQRVRALQERRAWAPLSLSKAAKGSHLFL
ncbi:hypothetical protein L1887_44523 [Cichorium endivia]|nr:hypothetical protein L1887_44523 [Cichorium endivia]